MFIESLGSHVYSVPTVPTWVAAVCAVFACFWPFVALGVAWRASVRRGLLVPLLGGVAAGAVASCLLWIGPGFALWALQPADACTAACTPVVQLFGTPLTVLALAGFWVSALWSVTGALSLIPEKDGGDPPWLAAIAPAGLALLSLCIAPLLVQVLLLASLGRPPQLVVDEVPMAHLGRSFDLEVSLQAPHTASLPPVHIEAQTLGPRDVEVGTWLRGLWIERTLNIEVVDEVSHPYFRLRVGDRWRFGPSHLVTLGLPVQPIEGDLPAGGFELEVTEVAENEAVRWFVLERTGLSPATYQVLAADGALRTTDGEPFLETPDAANSSACEFQPVGSCLCEPRDPGPGRIYCPPAPRRSSGGLLGALGTVLSLGLEVVTLGQADTMLDRRSGHTDSGTALIAFQPGPDGAPSVREAVRVVPLPPR